MRISAASVPEFMAGDGSTAIAAVTIPAIPTSVASGNDVSDLLDGPPGARIRGDAGLEDTPLTAPANSP